MSERAPAGLDVDSLHIWRGDRHVLQGVSLSVNPGELLHVWGPNGTGKTTLLRVVCGLLRPEQGTVTWLGHPIDRVRAEYQSAMTFAAHETALKSDLTALENLRYTVGLKRAVSDQKLLDYLAQTGVSGCADLPAKVLSAGQRRRVAMARVLAVNARLWLLDEPYTNLDGNGAKLMANLLENHVKNAGFVVIVAHHELDVAVNIRRLELAS